jgi:hypothetical protein
LLESSAETEYPFAAAPATAITAHAAVAELLVAAFYRGLGADPAQATRAMRKRDLAIARDLVDSGATAGEAEAYAREAIARAGRVAPVDLRSYERERLSWRAQRKPPPAPLGGLRLVTGQGLSD